MSTENYITVNYDQILEKIIAKAGFENEKEVAKLFDLSGSDLSNRKKRGTLLPFIIKWAIDENVNINWLLSSTGEIDPDKVSYPLSEGFKTADIGGELTEGFVQVPRYEVAASAGGGAVIHSEQIVDHLSFKAEWVHNALGVPVKDLALINVTGDSMEPTLSEGDLILIDMSHRGMKDNAIYVLQLNGSLLVKRLQHKLDGSVVVKSDNLIYDPETVSGEAIELLNIIGRVVWCGRRM
jgi:phage repressor protein C with HTH and peptisase S24 domain